MTIDRRFDPTCVSSSSFTNYGKQFLKRGPAPLRRRKRAREELEKDDLEVLEDTKEFREAMTALEQTLNVNPKP